MHKVFFLKIFGIFSFVFLQMVLFIKIFDEQNGFHHIITNNQNWATESTDRRKVMFTPSESKCECDLHSFRVRWNHMREISRVIHFFVSINEDQSKKVNLVFRIRKLLGVNKASRCYILSKFSVSYNSLGLHITCVKHLLPDSMEMIKTKSSDGEIKRQKQFRPIQCSPRYKKLQQPRCNQHWLKKHVFQNYTISLSFFS